MGNKRLQNSHGKRGVSILQLAIPNIVSNITVPLLGMVDLAIVGHLGNKSYIGAVAVGATIFNFIYWNFGFLRMGTSGLTAQAYGRRNLADALTILMRAFIVGISISLILLSLQIPIEKLAFFFIQTSDEVAPLASAYFSILIWAAPATLGLYVFKGWLIGMQNSTTPMIIAILVNVMNILLSLFFVFSLKMKIEGVALGSLLAQYVGLLAAVLFFLKKYGRLRKKLNWKEVFRLQEMLTFFNINGNIFLRTLCMIAVFTFFTSASAKMGDTILAVNTLLMQLFTLFSYVMDGFAYAAESLIGKYFGAKNIVLLKQTIRGLMKWGIVLSLIFTLLYALFGNGFLGILTNDQEVLNVARTYFFWTLPVPIVGFSAFLWDGIFIGAAAAKAMRNAVFVATAAFFILYFSFVSKLEVHALWIAFLAFLALRCILQPLQVKTAIYDKM